MPFNLSPCVQNEYEFRSVASEEKEKLVYLARRKTFWNKKNKLNPQRNAGPNQTSAPLSNIWQIRTKWNNTVAKWDNTVAKWNNCSEWGLKYREFTFGKWRFHCRSPCRRVCLNSLTFCGSVTVIVWKQGLVCGWRAGREPFLARAPPFPCCSRLASHGIPQMESFLAGFNRQQKVNRISPQSASRKYRSLLHRSEYRSPR